MYYSLFIYLPATQQYKYVVREIRSIAHNHGYASGR